tara:strand:+ start:8544 stop:8804 length:261 start_codon:yes stop_codon:yes gene_type:complete
MPTKSKQMQPKGHNAPNELQFKVNVEQSKKAAIQMKDIFEKKHKNGYNQEAIDKATLAHNKVNRKVPKGHPDYNKKNKHHPDYKKH